MEFTEYDVQLARAVYGDDVPVLPFPFLHSSGWTFMGWDVAAGEWVHDERGVMVFAEDTHVLQYGSDRVVIDSVIDSFTQLLREAA